MEVSVDRISSQDSRGESVSFSASELIYYFRWGSMKIKQERPAQGS